MKKESKFLGPGINDATQYGLLLTLVQNIANNLMCREAQIGTVSRSEANSTDSENYIAHNFNDHDKHTEPFEGLDDMHYLFLILQNDPTVGSRVVSQQGRQWVFVTIVESGFLGRLADIDE